MTSPMPVVTQDLPTISGTAEHATDLDVGHADPQLLAEIVQVATFAGADPAGVCAGVCYTWASYLRAGRLPDFVAAFRTQDSGGEVFRRIIATSHQVNDRLRAVHRQMQAVIERNVAMRTEIATLKEANSLLAAEARLPPGQQRSSLAVDVETTHGRMVALSAGLRESTARIDEQIRLATLVPASPPFAVTDGPVIAATAVGADLRRLLNRRPPRIVLIQLYPTDRRGSSHLVGCAITDDACYFIDPNTGLFQVADAGQVADLFAFAWSTLYADDYDRYRVRELR